jgi:exosortase
MPRKRPAKPPEFQDYAEDLRTHAEAAASSDASAAPTDSSLNLALAAGCGLALLAATVWADWPTLAEVFAAWMNQPDYSHGFLVAPLAIVFLFARREEFPAAAARPSLAGFAMLLGVAALRMFAGRYYLLPIDAWTIPLWIAGCVWLLFGYPCLRWSLPSSVFLWFMFPIPYSAERWLSGPLQAVATKVSTIALLMLGQPAISEGNTIWVGDHQMNVEEACSGLRIFVGIFALAFAFVLFSKWAWWQKALALIAALPIAIVANATRIVVTALLQQMVSGEAADKFSHDFAGLAMIPFAALLFWLFWVYLERVYPLVELVSPVSRMAAEPER